MKHNKNLGLVFALFLCVDAAQADKVLKCIYNNPGYQRQFNEFYKIQRIGDHYAKDRSVIEWLLADNNDVKRISMDLLGQTKTKARGLTAMDVNGTIKRPHTLRPIGCISGNFAMSRISTMLEWDTPETKGVQYWLMDPPFPHRKIVLKCQEETAQTTRNDSEVDNKKNIEEEISEFAGKDFSCPMQGNDDDVLKNYEGDEEQSKIRPSGSSSSNTGSSSSSSSSSTSSAGTDTKK